MISITQWSQFILVLPVRKFPKGVVIEEAYVTTVAFLDIMHAAAIASTLEWVASREEEHMPVLPLEVFISYAHQDRALKDELVKHLSLLQRQKLIKPWHDGDIALNLAQPLSSL